MRMETSISLALKPTSGWYLIKPCWLTSLVCTVRRKYQFSPASTSIMRTLEILSQTLLMSTKSWLAGGDVCEGIQITKTATLMAVMMATVPHLIRQIVFRCSAMRAIRLMMICMSNWISKTQHSRMAKRTGTLLLSVEFRAYSFRNMSLTLVPPCQRETPILGCQ